MGEGTDQRREEERWAEMREISGEEGWELEGRRVGRLELRMVRSELRRASVRASPRESDRV